MKQLNNYVVELERSNEEKKKKVIHELKNKYFENQKPIQKYLTNSPNITLKNCIITVSRNKVTLDFEINMTAWHLTINDPFNENQNIGQPWPLVQSDYDLHYKEYQKTLKPNFAIRKTRIYKIFNAQKNYKRSI